MLRLACHTAPVSDHDLDARLAAASDRLASLGVILEAGSPWPLAERFDHAPEASWGPLETLAHVEEMLPFWLGEAERILDATDPPATIGRAATDDLRIGVIERDRTLPVRELVARVQNGIDRWRRRWAALDEASRGRAGAHVKLGRVTVTDVAERFAVGHLEEHLGQLAESLATDPPAS
jgi:hypothetical protein